MVSVTTLAARTSEPMVNLWMLVSMSLTVAASDTVWNQGPATGVCSWTTSNSALPPAPSASMVMLMDSGMTYGSLAVALLHAAK